MSLRGLARELEKDPGVVSRWETGERTPKPIDVAQVLTLLGVTGDKYDEIVGLASGVTEKHWLAVTLPEQRQQMTTLLDYERSATSITEVAPLLMPGLLQTGAYTRAIMSAGGVPEDEVETRVAVRLGRADTIRRSDPVPYLALIGEASLRQVIGGPEIMTEQLQHLINAARLPNVDLRILPYRSGWHPALEGPFFFIETECGLPVVQLENRRSGLFLHDGPDVEIYRQAIDVVVQAAMGPAESTELIAQVKYERERYEDDARSSHPVAEIQS